MQRTISLKIQGLRLDLFTNEDGVFAVLPPKSKAGEKIILRAIADVRVGAAACSVSESSCNGGKCAPVSITVSESI